MALKIELKPNERLILGDCVVINAGQGARLTIEGMVAILPEKDIMTPGRADSLAKRIYLAMQHVHVEASAAALRDLPSADASDTIIRPRRAAVHRRYQ